MRSDNFLMHSNNFVMRKKMQVEYFVHRSSLIYHDLNIVLKIRVTLIERHDQCIKTTNFVELRKKLENTEE